MNVGFGLFEGANIGNIIVILREIGEKDWEVCEKCGMWADFYKSNVQEKPRLLTGIKGKIRFLFGFLLPLPAVHYLNTFID